ncbi:hypothetical protein [Methanolobus sp. WCC5]|uniref:hypothetical protein n=1 Tax=Methanolobus sp. WCC5 TaxID=3125785 RepID=UPI00324941DB
MDNKSNSNKNNSNKNNNNNKETNRKKTEDIELPELDEQIDAWCTIPGQSTGTKSADDIEIDAWCDNLPTDEEMKKKERMGLKDKNK